MRLLVYRFEDTIVNECQAWIKDLINQVIFFLKIVQTNYPNRINLTFMLAISQ